MQRGSRLSLRNELVPNWNLIASHILLFLTLAAGTSLGQSPCGELSPCLQKGRRLQRQIGGDQTHVFSLLLNERQYVRVVVEQEGADVQARLLSPGGRRITESSLPFGSYGPEAVSAVSSETGAYALEIKPASRSVRGSYSILLEELRPAAETDEKRTATEAAFYQGGGICFRGSIDAVNRVLEICAKRVDAALSAGNEQETGLELRRRAMIEATLGQRETCINTLRQELRIWESLNEPVRRMDTLERIGSILSASAPVRATQYYEEALKLREAAGDPLGLAKIHYDLGLLQSGFGDKQKALDHILQSLELYRKADNRLGQAIVTTTLGGLHFQLNNASQAKNYYRQALELRRAMKDRLGEAQVLSRLCFFQNSIEERQEAIGICQQALELVREKGDQMTEAGILRNMGRIYLQVDEIDRAVPYFEEALRLFRTLGALNDESAVLCHLAAIHEWQGKATNALEYFEKALAISRRMKNTWSEAGVLRQIGSLHYSRGETAKAEQFWQDSLLLSRKVRFRSNESHVTQALGQLALDRGQFDQARCAFEQALAYRRSTGEKALESQLLFQLARVERQLGRLEAARSLIAESLKIVESVRARIGVEEWRATYIAQSQEKYEFQIDLLMQMQQRTPGETYALEALQTAERARARLLAEMLRESSRNIREGVAPALLERERNLQQQLNERSNRLLRSLQGKPNENEIAAIRADLDELGEQLRQTRANIRQQYPRYAELSDPRTPTAREIQLSLPDQKTILLEFSLGRERSYLWEVTSDSITAHVLPARAEIERLTREVYELLTARNRRVKFEAADERRARIQQSDRHYPVAAARLSRMLFGALADRWKEKRLMIVPDGALHYLPFSALPEPQGENATAQAPLIAGHEIISLPSAATLALLRQNTAGRTPATKTIAVFADPVFDPSDTRLAPGVANTPRAQQNVAENAELLRAASDFDLATGGLHLPRLPFTRREAEAILGFAPPAERKAALDFHASYSEMTSQQLKEYKYLHIATHGLINSRRPELSGLVFSLFDEQGNSQNGFLQTHDIYNLKIPVELVVLSACRTGLGKEIRGEGLVGLTHSFFYAGAARVMVSLWDVNDQATSELMTRFYKELLRGDNVSPATALRSAQTALWKEKGWQAPYYWAGFVLLGNI